jgi:hypothetical protein
MEEEEREAPPKEVPAEGGASPTGGEDTCQIDRPPDLDDDYHEEDFLEFDLLDALDLEVVRQLMDMVNALDCDLLPRSLDIIGLGRACALSYQVTQRAAIQRRGLLGALVVYGVEPIDEVGVTVSFDRHFPGRIRIVADPSLDGIVSVRMLTGFMRSGVILRPACVEVMRHVQDDSRDKQVGDEETIGKEN